MKDEDCEDRAQEQLASIKRDMKASMEDAAVRAMHKVMAEFEAKSDERLMEDWGPGPHEVHSLPAPQPAQRKPLTREQVKGLITEAGYDTASPQERADFINGIRHGEAAHGIKGDT